MKKFYYVLFISFFTALNLLAQDSTMKVVGPGYKYYSIFKSSPGPYNFRILEIDLKQSKNKIETVLAKEVLGNGFEKTSSMAARKDKNGHIVIGAVNGDFFGISDGTNPYTFLTGNMISNGEYTSGKSTKKAEFAVTNKNKLILDDIGFSGTLYAKNDSLFTINSFNDTVKSNQLILFNKFFGLSTRSTISVTEVKLKPVDPFEINGTKKFLVTQKAITGNMAISAGDYVFSGSGTAKTFLDNYVQVGDTVKIRIGTNPNRGTIMNMMGGGPRIINNGAVVAGIDGTNLHPRTAVGFNQDSSKVFFVTVDGRQPGLSIGMHLVELAQYMLTLGCYQAMNLDGGGSTTMVIRGKVVNSPSDAGGERSCGNALLAVCEINAKEILKTLKLSPKSIFIDSVQSKKITTEGIDIYGYPVQLFPYDIAWKIVGIKGTIDSLGFFRPGSTGTGYIIGTVDSLSDTIQVTVTGNVIPVWQLSKATNNIPSWLSPTGSTERGMAYGFINGNHRLYVVNRPYATILNAGNGDAIGQLVVTGITGGTYTLNDIDVTEDGIIIGANLTTAASTANIPFKVYKWTSETATPEVIIEYSGAAYRLGDKITVVGSIANGTAIVYASAQATNKVLKWVMNGTTFNQTPTEITLAGVTTLGSCPSVAPKGLGNSNFYINGNSVTPKEYSPTGTLIGTVPNSLVDSRSNAIRYFESGNKKYIVTYQYGFPNENAKILDVTKGPDSAVVVEATPTLGDNVNNIGTSGDVAYRKYANGIYLIYVLATNNGICSYQLNTDSTTTSVSGNLIFPSKFELFQNYPNPFNPVTTIKYSLPVKSTVDINIYDILGNRIENIFSGNKDAGFHSFTWPKNKQYTSGVYFYELRTGSFRSIKKLLLIK